MHTTPSELARFILYAAVAELADAQDLKSCGTNLSYRFDSGLRHWLKMGETLNLQRFSYFFVSKSLNTFEHFMMKYQDSEKQACHSSAY